MAKTKQPEPTKSEPVTSPPENTTGAEADKGEGSPTAPVVELPKLLFKFQVRNTFVQCGGLVRAESIEEAAKTAESWLCANLELKLAANQS